MFSFSKDPSFIIRLTMKSSTQVLFVLLRNLLRLNLLMTTNNIKSPGVSFSVLFGYVDFMPCDRRYLSAMP